MRNQKGITMIALIITIVVMLILVGVTVNVALTGGLFSTAKEATIKHEIATIQDMVESERIKIQGKKIEEGKANELPTVEETLKSLTNENSLVKIAIEGNDYITNVEGAPSGNCYKIEPSKINIETPRGRGEAGDIFIVDGKHEVYYIKSGATIQETPRLDTTWYLLTDEEKAELEEKEKISSYPLEDEYGTIETEYIIADMEDFEGDWIDDCSCGRTKHDLVVSLVEDTYDNGNKTDFAITVGCSSGSGFIYASTSWYLIYEIDEGVLIPWTWHYIPTASYPGEDPIVWTGDFPFEKSDLNIYCETYLNRIIENFK